MPTIVPSGSPTVSGPDNFSVQTTGALNNAFGLLLWSNSPDNVPFGGGNLCLSNPSYLFPAQFSGGTPGLQATDCTGTFGNALSQAWFAQNGLLAGTAVYVQYLSRDNGFPAQNNYSLSDGMRFTIGQ